MRNLLKNNQVGSVYRKNLAYRSFTVNTSLTVPLRCKHRYPNSLLASKVQNGPCSFTVHALA